MNATGGVYTVSGTIGQPDAGEMSGGLYAVSGGFWYPSAAQCPASGVAVPEMIEDAGKMLVVSTKNRFLSFTAGDTGRQQMILVTFRNLPFPYDQFDNRSMWVGEPYEMSDIAGRDYPSPPNFWTAMLECPKPAVRDWTGYGTIHVHSPFIVPDGTYEIRVLDSTCTQADIWNPSISPVLTLATSRYGDVSTIPKNNQGEWCPPDGSPDITRDVNHVKLKYENKLGLSKPRAELGGERTDPTVDFIIDISKDVLYAKEAFEQKPYPFPVPPGEAWPCVNPPAP